MGEFHIGNISSGRDTNVESNIGDNNSIQSISNITESIENIKNGIEDETIKAILDNLVTAMKKKDEPSIGECLKKLATSGVALSKIAFTAIKALL